MTIAKEVLDAVRDLFEGGGTGRIEPFLAEDIELRPPTYGKSWHGSGLVGRLLHFAAKSLEGLKYTDCVSDGALHILRFEARIGEQLISGVDVLRIDVAGKISMFEIFARPPKSVLVLRDAMAAHVSSDPEVAAKMGL